LFETTSEWKPDEVSALLEWIDGMPLADIAGYVTVPAETQSVAEPDDLALRWIEQLCQAFAALHRTQLVHGDVSPVTLRNFLPHRKSLFSN
jgi:serine/threonine protein kinase